MADTHYNHCMKTMRIRLPEPLAADIEKEAITDLVGAVTEGPSDRSARKKYYLKKTGYGRNRADR